MTSATAKGLPKDREMILPGKKNRGRWKRSVPVIRKGII